MYLHKRLLIHNILNTFYSILYIILHKYNVFYCIMNDLSSKRKSILESY